MEGFLSKNDGFFSGWVQYYFILHEDTLMYMDKQGGKIVGSIHLKIAKFDNVPKDPLQIQIFNGTNEILLRTASIKEKVDWTNALIEAQRISLEGRYDSYKRKGSQSPGEKKPRESFA
jgi:hypothetical protein